MPNVPIDKSHGFFLGFDFGTKRIGLAIGQAITKTATPLFTLSAHHGIPRWEEIGKIITEWQPQAFIVGLALQPDNSHSATSLAAQKFGRRLAAKFRLPVYFINERLTSFAAQERIRETNELSAQYRDVDAMAAVIILESWLNSDLKEISSNVTAI